MEISVDDLTAALIRGGFFFPSQRVDARIAAWDLIGIIEAAQANAAGTDPEGGAR